MGSKGALFRYADVVDKLLLFFGTLGCMGDGQQTPLTMLLLSSIVEEYAVHGVKHSLSHHTVNKYTLRLIYLATGVGLSSFIEGICWTRTAERQTSRMRTEYLSAILRQEVGFFDTNSTSTSAFQVISTLSSDVQVIQDTMAEKIPNFLANMSSFLSSIVVGFILSWRLGIASFPFSILMILPAIIYGAKLKDLGEQIKDAYGVAGGIAEQSISSIRTVYSYVGENQTLKRFNSALEKSMQLGFKQGFGKGLVIGSLGLMYATWAFLSWVGSVLVTKKQENGGRVFMGEICAIWGGLSLMSALPNLTFMLEATIAATRICQMIDRIPSINSENKKGKILKDFRGEITFKAVDFSYPSRPEKPILQGLDLHVKAGKTVGLVGGSGSGKSTIFSLLQRFHDPVNGDILLDRHNIKRLQIQWLRSQMGLVNQEPILFATSIKENILFGKEEAAMEEMICATKAANAHEFISKLPDGYDTQVGQFGVQLSGGQKQRIAIARALIRDPKILLLDEATSALDAQSERVVQDALDMASRGRTTLVIAHRLSTVQKADVLVVIQSGRVVESGSHDELMQRNNGRGGIYSEMVQLQQSTTENETCYPLKLPSSSIPHTPVRKILSWQSSPATPFSPAYSTSIPASSLEYNEESLTKASRSSSFQWRLLRMNAPEWKHTILGCLGAIGSGMVLPINSYCLGAVVSVYFIDDTSILKKEIRSYSYIFLTLAVLSFISSLLQHYNFAIMGERLMKRTREMLLAKILTFEIGWFDKDENSSASISARLATESSLVRSLVAERISLLVQVFFNASLAYILSFVLAWRLAIVMVAMQPFIISCFYSKNIFMKRMSHKAQKAQGESSQLAMEATIHHRTITAFSSQKRMLTLFEIALKAPRKENVKMAWISGLVLSFSQFLTTASIAFTFWYGGILVNQNIVKPKQLYQVFFILMGTGKGIADAGTMTSDIAKSGKAIRSVFAILDRTSLIHPEDSSGAKVRKALKGDIELKSVFFSYPARPDHLILQGLTLKIEAGKTIALVGPSGCGKSTIIGLIERFYDPTRGTILIDNCDVKKYNLRSLRSHIGLVSQEPTLFAGTIRNNVAYGNANVAESEIKKAANLANADDFISSMKDGYDTCCGERGVQLSGGQKQRIAIARAILKNPEILLLDEATSALDSVSEKMVQEALEKMMVGRTCIIIAHRLSTIQNADSIAVLKNGKLVELGSHSDLIRNKPNGAYSSMIRLQNNRYA